ncbi:MAG TPA: GAP family protein [Solirubrobacteraceae bacterium]|nr:GAP family protein [Solirubrobacteraceae bacterium]
MLKLSVAVVAIALPDCINPSLIGGELFVATGRRPRRRTAAFTLGAWVVTFTFGLVFALGLGDLILALVPKPSAPVKYGLVAGAGLVLVISGTVLWVRRRALVSGEAGRHRSEPHQPPALIGAGIAGLELLTAFPYFAAIALIAGSGVSNAGKLWLLLLYCVVYTLPLIAIVVTITLAGEGAERILERIGDWMLAHWPAVVGPLTAVFGFAVLVFGVVQLASG